MKAFTSEALGKEVWGWGSRIINVPGHAHWPSILITAVRSWSANIKASRIKISPGCGCGDDPITLESVFWEEKAWISSFLNLCFFFMLQIKDKWSHSKKDSEAVQWISTCDWSYSLACNLSMWRQKISIPIEWIFQGKLPTPHSSQEIHPLCANGTSIYSIGITAGSSKAKPTLEGQGVIMSFLYRLFKGTGKWELRQIFPVLSGKHMQPISESHMLSQLPAPTTL